MRLDEKAPYHYFLHRYILRKDHMGIQERLYVAQRSDNLQAKSHLTMHIDLIAASGLAERDHRVGALAHRTFEDQRFAPRLFELASKAIIGKARAKHWHIKKREDLEAFTVAVGKYWLKPYCTKCDGRGVVVEHQIAKDLCTACNGTGNRAMPRPDDVGLGGVVDEKRFERYMREALECLDRHIAGYLHKTRLMLG